MKKIIVLSIFILSLLRVSAQERQQSAEVFFRQGISQIELDYKNNRKSLYDFLNFVSSIKRDSSLLIIKLEMKASASPDGSRAVNKRIAKQRALSLKKYIQDNVSIPEELMVVKNNGIAWNKLRNMVDTSNIEYKKEILYILDNVPDYVFKNKEIYTGKKKELMDLKGGKPYNVLIRDFFPALRSANLLELYYIDKESLQNMNEEIILLPEEEKIQEESIVDEAEKIEIEEEEIEEDIEIEENVVQQKKNLLFLALKTNLLYDLALTPNIGVEIPIGDKWSIAGEWAYAWWSKDSNHKYWRMYGGSLEFRRWFGNKTNRILTGHHVGIYASAGTYDIEFGNKGYQSKFSYTVGASYGYSLPIAKSFNLDFELGIGYLGGEYKEYEPKNGDYIRIATKKRNYFGPTKGQISLVWLIGNYNK